MPLLPILEAPHPVLKTKAAPVEGVDDDLRRLMDDMLETMYAAPGIGLAAPQVGLSKRVVVVDLSKEDEPNAPLRMVNPEVTWRSEATASSEEGCLSLPEVFADVRRPAEVKVRFLDEHGREQELHADGLFGRCLQHEIDHLDGILFTDRISALKRDMVMRKLAKLRRAKAG